MTRGPKQEWLFRFYYPRPGQEQTHSQWRQWLQDNMYWPDEDQLYDETYQMMMPSEWRRNAYKNVQTMDEFAEVQARRMEQGVTWNARNQATQDQATQEAT